MKRIEHRSAKQRHLDAKGKEIELALGGKDVEKKKELVEQTEELIGLAHQLTYHQLQEYNYMLVGLAILAHEVDPSQLKKICK